MMKNIYIILASFMALVSCTDVLDKTPMNQLSDSNVWSDEVLINSYLTEVYGEMVFFVNDLYGNSMYSPEFLAKNWFDMCMSTNLSDEAKDCWVGSGWKYAVLTDAGGMFELWPYDIIRRLNVFIERLATSPVSADFKVNKIAEARFLRAFTYFSMVKRYGGVPLITKAQNLSDPQEELYTPRAKEVEVYDFVISETKEIAKVLKAELDATDKGRPTKFAALALESRAALYAASEATWGTVKLDGLVGIPSSLAHKYWETARDAANEIILAKKHGLYKRYWSSNYADKVKNYQYIFLDESSSNNEIIFVKQFNGPDGNSAIGHGWDLYEGPKGYNMWGGGNQSAVYLNMVEEYEYVDGTSGALNATNLASKLWTTDELWGNKDPRFKASIYTQNTSWLGNTLQFYNGIQVAGQSEYITSGSYQGVLAQGQSYGMGSTGFGVLKYLTPGFEKADNNASATDWIVFRYGEVLLNFAEASFELGETTQALNAINEIRDRAGIARLLTIDREKIRHERKVELAFENHRFWDLRRWKTATTALSGNFRSLRYVLDFSTKKFKLEIIPAHGTSTIPLFGENKYYFPITRGRIANNPKLIENPGFVQ